MKTYKELITELFDTPVSYKKVVDKEYRKKYQFSVDNIPYTALISNEEDGVWEMIFEMHDVKNNRSFTDVTNVGQKVAIIVFSTVLKILSDFIKEVRPRELTFSASKSWGESRATLYKSMVKRYIPKGYVYEVDDRFYEATFTIRKKK